MAVAVDAVSSKAFFGSDTTPVHTHTASGTNRYVLVGVSQKQSAAPTGVTYGSSSMTLVQGDVKPSTNVRLDVYELIAPATGSQNITVTYPGSTDWSTIEVISFTGVDQTTPHAADAVDYSWTTDTAATVTTVADDMAVQFMRSAWGGGAANSGTTIANENATQFGTLLSMSGYRLATGTSTSIGFNRDVTGDADFGVSVNLAVKQAGAADAPVITDVDTDEVITSDQTNVVITGTDFDTATVRIDQGSTQVTQSIDSQSATSIQFDVVFDSGSTDLKHGSATLRVTNTDTQFDTQAITINAPTGHLYVDVGTPATSGDRITASPDIASGDQIQARGVGGGSVPSGLSLATDATFSFSGTPAAFDVRVWDSGDSTWGSWATQSVTRRRSRILLTGVG